MLLKDTREYWSKDSFKRKLERDKFFDLRRIDLSFNRITDDSAKTIAESYKDSQGIIGIELFGSCISNTGLRIITEHLPTRLQTLDLSFIQFGPEGAQILSETLRDHPTLNELDCCGCNIGTTGLSAITDLLCANPRIEIIRLSWNDIDSEGGQIIAQMLEQNHSIQKLDLNRNQLMSKGVESIAQSLRNHSSLVEIDLRYNQIDESGCRTILDALKTNKILQQVKVEEWKQETDPSTGIDYIENASQHFPFTEIESLLERNILEFQTQRRMACVQVFKHHGKQNIEYYLLKQDLFPMTGF
jgi:Ran GTPase-activating protein (RanGAP) involved in mRNA processing and transport